MNNPDYVSLLITSAGQTLLVRKKNEWRLPSFELVGRSTHNSDLIDATQQFLDGHQARHLAHVITPFGIPFEGVILKTVHFCLVSLSEKCTLDMTLDMNCLSAQRWVTDAELCQLRNELKPEVVAAFSYLGRDDLVAQLQASKSDRPACVRS